MAQEKKQHNAVLDEHGEPIEDTIAWIKSRLEMCIEEIENERSEDSRNT